MCGLFSACAHAPDLLGQLGLLYVLLSTCTLHLEAALSFDLSKQGHCFMEENSSVHMLSNANSTHLPSSSYLKFRVYLETRAP